MTTMRLLHLLLPLLMGLVSPLRWTYNPGCSDDTVCGHANMVHVVSTHTQYLWSTQHGLAAIVFSGSHDLAVNWTKYNDDKAAVTVGTPSSFGIALRSVNLTDGKGNSKSVDLTTEEWLPIDIANSSSSGGVFTFSYSNSYATVKVRVSDTSGRIGDNPKMLYSKNNTIVDVQLDLSKIPGLSYTDKTSGSIVLELGAGNNISEKHTRSYDDEATPALFRFETLEDSFSAGHSNGVYSMWRPVVYGNSERTAISSLEMEGSVSPSSNPAASLLAKYYKRSDIQELHLKFLPEDGKEHVPSTVYWTFSLGVGSPPEEGLSPMGKVLTLLIVVVPCGAILLAVVTVLFRRRRNASPGQGYRAI